MTTYDDIKNRVLALNYEFFEGELNLNMIWERTSNIFTNKFSDFLHIAYQQNGQNLVLTIPATTKPGLNGEGAILNPPTVHGITGTDVIIPGQYKGTWEWIDAPTGKPYPFDKEFFRQIKGVNYWRDGEKLLNITKNQEHDNTIDGTQWHKMSNPEASGFDVNNWSEGCMGAEEPVFKTIFSLVREAVAKYGPVFTGTLIDTTPTT